MLRDRDGRPGATARRTGDTGDRAYFGTAGSHRDATVEAIPVTLGWWRGFGRDRETSSTLIGGAQSQDWTESRYRTLSCRLEKACKCAM